MAQSSKLKAHGSKSRKDDKKMTANAGDLDLQSRKFKYKNMIQIDLFLNNEDI